MYQRISSVMDLLTVNAKYHEGCYKKLLNYHVKETKEPKIVYTDKIDQTMELIYNFLLSSEDCQFTMAQLLEVVKNCDVIPSEKTIKSRLQNRFSDQIIFSSKMGFFK